MYCENCGAKIDDDSKFCEYCGARIEEDSGDSAPEPVMDLDDLMSLGAEDAEDRALQPVEKTMVFRKPPAKEVAGKESQEEEGDLPEQEEVSGESEIVDISLLEPKNAPGISRMDQEAFSGQDLLQEPEPEEKQELFSDLREEEELAEAADGWPVWPDPKETEKDEWLQAEIAKTMESLQKSSNDFFYEDLTGYSEAEQEDVAERCEGQEAVEASVFGANVRQQDATDEMDITSEDQKPKAVSYPPPEAMEEYVQQHFCMACGQILPAGAAFCSACGTPTGDVRPPESDGRSSAGGGMALRLLKRFFIKPASAIGMAASDHAFLSGIGFFVFKDAVLAVLAALLSGRLSKVAAMLGPWLLSSDPFGFGAKVFLSGILLDALWVGILFGAAVLFHGKTSIRTLIGVCGTAGLLTAALLILTVVLAAALPGTIFAAGAVTAVVTAIAMAKAVYAAIKLEENLQLFLMTASAACYTILLFALAGLLR